MNQKTKSNGWTFVLFIVYLIVLTWIILFKMETDLSLLSGVKQRSINFVPFAGSLIVNGRIAVSEILMNVLAFVPFGIYIAILRPRWKFIYKVFPAVGVSFLYELLQYILAVGASDITDLIGNTLGGIIGIGLFFICSIVLGRKNVLILNILATIGTVLVVLFLGLLVVVN